MKEREGAGVEMSWVPWLNECEAGGDDAFEGISSESPLRGGGGGGDVDTADSCRVTDSQSCCCAL